MTEAMLAFAMPFYVAVAIGWWHGLREARVPPRKAATVATLWAPTAVVLGLVWLVAWFWHMTFERR